MGLNNVYVAAINISLNKLIYKFKLNIALGIINFVNKQDILKVIRELY
jgi:hypothetical protein